MKIDPLTLNQTFVEKTVHDLRCGAELLERALSREAPPAPRLCQFCDSKVLDCKCWLA